MAGGSAGDVGRVTNRAAGGGSAGGAGFSAAGGGSAGGAGFFAGGGGLLVALIKLGGASAGGAGGVGFVVGIFLGTIVLLLCSFNNLTQMGSFTNEGAGGPTGTCFVAIAAAGSLANCTTQWWAYQPPTRMASLPTGAECVAWFEPRQQRQRLMCCCVFH